MSIPTYIMKSSDLGEYAYWEVSLVQSTEDNKDVDGRGTRRSKKKELEKHEAYIQAYYDKHGAERSVTEDEVKTAEQITLNKLEELEMTETPQRRPSLVVVLHVRAEINSGQWCKV